ncbi:protein mono-ADP-ribosyltransferase PARP12 isoform X1 [Centroberyx affinis]|uniref:protein mono-ADP-ribosyltransferase PARP12 isoform X1 n=1 Tax=Centroberyx affinis TaxID=166261 RepID=UPI003A5BD75F
MTSVVSKLVFETVCENQGCLDFKRLHELIGQRLTVAGPVLHSVLFDDGKIAIQEGREKASRGQSISPDSLIVAKTPVRLCQKLPADCPQCDQLHLCRYYVCGNCRFGNKCKNSHILASSYNAALLTRFGLQDLTEKQLFQLLLQNDPYLLPEICPHYNKGNGEHGSCKFAASCTNLHLCQHFVQGDCKFGPSCKRAHNMDAHVMKILNGRGFSHENIKIIEKIYRNKFIISGQQERQAVAVPAYPVVRDRTRHPSNKSSTSSAGATNPISETDRDEICLYFIRRHCSFKEKCVRVHYHLPYKWQVLDVDGVTWKDLPNMEDIEKAYCDPGQDTSCTDQPSQSSLAFGFLSIQPRSAPQSVDFLKMRYGGSPVRRLSTASSVSKPPHFILATQWLWYWKEENGKWVEYGIEESGDAPASVTSQTLENVYLADRETDIPFGAGKQKYILYFKGTPGAQQMYQQNIQYKTKREVRRRPRFVSAHEVELKLKSTSSDSSTSSTAEAVPAHWDKNALLDFSYKLVPLSNSMKEYGMVEKLFKLTMPHSVINSIKRIQNPSLWRMFQWQKEQMKEKNGGKPVDERYLFHGTDESLIDAICEQNFDWRVCGVHGTHYGKGSYFANAASYSDRYAKIKSSKNKIMFVALVLVGEFTKGSSSYVRPPAKGTTNRLYDSCVDSETNPNIFVVFDKLQIYPEYLIDYS